MRRQKHARRNDEYKPETESFTPGVFCSVFNVGEHGEATMQERENTYDP